MAKVESLLVLANRTARDIPRFFEISGPGTGDRLTNRYMRFLREIATAEFGCDYAQQRICGDNQLAPDFYFPDEGTIVEVALSLRNPNSEFERDLLKAILARAAGHNVTDLVFISRPNKVQRHQKASSQAFIDWFFKTNAIAVSIHDLLP